MLGCWVFFSVILLVLLFLLVYSSLAGVVGRCCAVVCAVVCAVLCAGVLGLGGAMLGAVITSKESKNSHRTTPRVHDSCVG